MQDGLVIDPLKGESAGKIVGWNKASLSKARRKSFRTKSSGHWYRESIEYVDRFAGYLLDANDAVDGIGKKSVTGGRGLSSARHGGCTNTFRRPMPSPEASSSMAWSLLPN